MTPSRRSDPQSDHQHHILPRRVSCSENGEAGDQVLSVGRHNATVTVLAATLLCAAPAAGAMEPPTGLPEGRTVIYQPGGESAPSVSMYIRHGRQLTVLTAFPADAFCATGTIRGGTAFMKSSTGARYRIPVTRLGKPTSMTARKALRKVIWPSNRFKTWQKIRQTC